MSQIFKYAKPGKRTNGRTLLWIILAAAVILLIGFFWGQGGYIIAWVVSLIIAVVLLCILSIPRHIEVSDTAVEIRCVVEITRIPLSDLRTIRRVKRADMKRIVPLVGGWGFFGYYGYYLDTKKWETVKLYCTEWSDFVEFTDIYEKRYYINSPEADGLVDAIARAAAVYYAEDK